MTDSDFIEVAFRLWRETQIEGPPNSEAPSHLYAAMAGAGAQNWRDVALKLAMWRWTGSCLPQNDSTLNPRDRLVYSAFRDAVRLSNRPDLGTQTDRDTDFFADLLTDARAA